MSPIYALTSPKYLILFILFTFCALPAQATILTSYPTNDGYVWSGSPNTNYHSSPNLESVADYQGTLGTATILMAFEGTSIPAGSVINSATLTLKSRYADNCVAAAKCNLLVYHNSAAFDEYTMTYNNAPGIYMPGFAQSPYFTQINNADVTVSVNLTGIVRDWQYGIRPNYGIRIIGGAETVGYSSGWIYFYSKENGVQSLEPTLTIDYTAPSPPTAWMILMSGSSIDKSCVGSECLSSYILTMIDGADNTAYWSTGVFDDNEVLVVNDFDFRGKYNLGAPNYWYIKSCMATTPGSCSYSALNTSSSGTFNASALGLAVGRYHIKLYRGSWGWISTLTSGGGPVYFYVTNVGTAPTDSLNTSKSTYVWSDTVWVSGNAQGISTIRIEQGGNVIVNFGARNGVFNLSTNNLASGNYNAVMLRDVSGHGLEAVTSKSFVVTPNPAVLSIVLLDPGNPDGGTDLTGSTADRKFAIGDTRNWLAKTPVGNWYLITGVTSGSVRIQATVNYKNANDTVIISSPHNVNQTFRADAYDISVVVPNEPESIGTWTATIINSANTSQRATSTLIAFLFNTYFEPPEVISGTAYISSSATDLYVGDTAVVSWSVTNISQYYVKMGRVGDTAPLYNQIFSATGGTYTFQFTKVGSYSIGVMTSTLNGTAFVTRAQVAITVREKTVTAVPTMTGTNGEIEMPPSDTLTRKGMSFLWLLSKTWFWGIVFMIMIMSGLIIKMTQNGGSVDGAALIIVFIVMLDIFSLFGMFDPYKWMILVTSWIIGGIYWKIDRVTNPNP
jgi:hypothetical protein